VDHILQLEDGKNRFLKVVNELSQAFALPASNDSEIILSKHIDF
jgi:hypothetical protein